MSKRTNISEDKINGHIAEIEGQLQKLASDHQTMVNQFNAAVMQNQAAFNQLHGRLATWKEMLPKPKLPKP